MKRYSIQILFAAILALAFSACQEAAPVFVGEAEPADFSLSYQVPQEFNFEIPKEGPEKYKFALELTYFPEQMQGWEAIPLYYILVRPGSEEDKRFSVKVKDEKGEWRGELADNENDRIFEETFEEGIALQPGKYNFKLYGDGKEEGKPILGIVKVTFKVYEAK